MDAAEPYNITTKPTPVHKGDRRQWLKCDVFRHQPEIQVIFTPVTRTIRWNTIRILRITSDNFLSVGAHIYTALFFCTSVFASVTRITKCHSRQYTQGCSSVGERFLHTEEVGSSILPTPTIFN